MRMLDSILDVRGERLGFRLHEAEGDPRGAVVMVHGFQSCMREFAGAPADLAARGFHVATVDLRGHGRSSGPRGYLSSARVVEDLFAIADHVRSETGIDGLGIVGHSLGGLWAALALSRIPVFRAGVLVAPVDNLLDETNTVEAWGYRRAIAVSRVLSRFGIAAPRIPYKFHDRYDLLFADPEAAQRARGDPFLLPDVLLHPDSDLPDLRASRFASEVEQPTLVVHALKDRVVNRAGSRRVFDALAGEKSWVEIDSGHSAFADHAAGELLDHVDRWLTTHLDASRRVRLATHGQAL